MLSKLMEDMKIAMKSKEKPKVVALRNLIGKIKQNQINTGKKLDENECIKILSSSAKQLKDSIEQYKVGNRQDLVEQESYELSIVKQYLPKPLSKTEVNKIIKKIILENNANSIKDMGKTMNAAMKILNGKIDGKIIQEIVKEELMK